MADSESFKIPKKKRSAPEDGEIDEEMEDAPKQKKSSEPREEKRKSVDKKKEIKKSKSPEPVVKKEKKPVVVEEPKKKRVVPPEEQKANVIARKKARVEVDLEPPNKWWENYDLDDGKKWRTLEHHGVFFPPSYTPHGIKMKYKGEEVNLTPEQEEVANFWAALAETEWATKAIFRKNFFAEFQKVLKKGHRIQDLEHCDFSPITQWQLEQKEIKKNMELDEKKALKAEKQKIEDHYAYAMVDGFREKVGNFRIEPPGLFRGRGDHPKAGILKQRVFPEEVTINIGEDSRVPKCPLPGHAWKDVVHDNSVTWLAYWKDTVNNDFKYVWLAASSRFKGKSDMEKYEKARKLKRYIDRITKDYTQKISSSNAHEKQLGTALYLIDKLALRVGNEKGEDEADTVGCCSLRVEHIDFPEDNKISLDFLGKDSMRYQNTVEVDPKVFRNLRALTLKKKPEADLFDSISASSLNEYLKGLMPGLSAKVFRTYNASITLQKELAKTPTDISLNERVKFYNDANREVAILCNHQRSLPKNFQIQMEKMESKLEELKDQLQALKDHLAGLEGKKRKVKAEKKEDDEEKEKKMPADAEKTRKAIQRQKARIEDHELKMKIKDDNKTVALTTSKINYMDPRITVAWCKSHEVPIEKNFNKSLRSKFPWAMYVEPSWQF
eukprot:GILJ01004249.1.p1 GENE.GILJ01004249.1~~GILJ01004249.1.p1  ORF type:complete len:682 (-),score=165.09 GILJ01004249.1:78-2078(-)